MLFFAGFGNGIFAGRERRRELEDAPVMHDPVDAGDRCVFRRNVTGAWLRDGHVFSFFMYLIVVVTA